MADDALLSPSIERVEHDPVTSAKRVADYTWNGSTPVRVPTPFLPYAYDYVSVAYPDDTTEVYTFKQGGSGGTTVETVTITYVDNTKEQLSTVTRVWRP